MINKSNVNGMSGDRHSIILSKKITIRYIAYQIIYFAYASGISSFAATYLLAKGLNASQVGMLLAISNLMACFGQPIVGDIVDRLKNFVLPRILAGVFAGVLICLSVIQFLNPPLAVVGLLYGTVLFISSMTNSLNNSLCAYYTNRGCAVNYGVGQGVGSFSFSVASLGFGYVMAWLGVDSMIWIVFVLALFMIIVVLGYPKVEDLGVKKYEDNCEDLHNCRNSAVTAEKSAVMDERVSIIEFFGKYKLFVVTMVGVMLVSMCHYISENYFIAIFEKIGGGSEDVGIAMFVACSSAVPFFLFFEKMREKIDIYTFLKLAGIFFMLKTGLIMLATEVWHIYLIQLLQTFTYGFIYQPLYYMARRLISEADLVKGQAVAISMYTLGGACGSFAGGRILDMYGVEAMLWLALGVACAGAIIINLTLRKDRVRI